MEELGSDVVEISGPYAAIPTIEVYGAKETDICLISAPNILNIPNIRLGPIMECLPWLSGVTPCGFYERNEALRVQVVDLAVHTAEVGRIYPVDVGIDILVPGDLARKFERSATFVVHVLGTLRARQRPRISNAGSVVVIKSDLG